MVMSIQPFNVSLARISNCAGTARAVKAVVPIPNYKQQAAKRQSGKAVKNQSNQKKNQIKKNTLLKIRAIQYCTLSATGLRLPE